MKGYSLPRRWRLPSAWNLLSLAGAGFVPGGALLVFIAWQRTPGPYIIGERYPFGSYTSTWQVSLGFAFVAFGMLFLGAIPAARVLRSRVLLICLLGGYVLIWFPHAWIGVTLFVYDPDLRSFREWAPYLPLIILWMLLVVAGFVGAWRELSRSTAA